MHAVEQVQVYPLQSVEARRLSCRARPLLPPEGGLCFLQDSIIRDARRDNSPASGEITPPKSLLHICQQNYKKTKGGGFSPPCLFPAYSGALSHSAWTLSSLSRLIAKYSGESSIPI